MARAIWKGAVSFGLVNVPVSLYPAAHDERIDFDWLDKKSMDPIGYKRINKRTGKEVLKENIVRGIRQSNGRYVTLTDEEIRLAYPKSTQLIEIDTFVKAEEVPFIYLDKPYFLEPAGRSEKVYALLRESMIESGVIGIARVVMHNKEHLAALIATGSALMLDTLRWASEIRSPDDLHLPAAGTAGVRLTADEIKMAKQLIKGMMKPWHPEAYAAHFTQAVETLAAQKLRAGKSKDVAPLEELPEDPTHSNVIDLTELLKRSLGNRTRKNQASSQTQPPRATATKARRKRA